MYDWKKIYEDALTKLDDPTLEIDNMECLIDNLACEKTAFYERILSDTEKANTIKSRIERNRRKLCENQRKLWRASDNPTLQVAAYKLTATKEERDILNMTKSQIDVTAEKPFILLDYENKENA